MLILAFAIASRSWGLAQSGQPLDSAHIYAVRFCNLAQLGLLTDLNLAFTSGSCSPAGEFPELPYHQHSQPQVLCMLVSVLIPQSQLSLVGVAT